MDSITNPHFQRLALNAVTAAMGLFDGAELRLTKAPVGVSKTMLLADFTAQQADFNTYAAIVAVWADAFVGTDGASHVPAGLAQWMLANELVPNTVANVFVTTPMAAGLLAAGTFDSGQFLSSLDDGVTVVPDLSWTDFLANSGLLLELLTTAHCDRLILNALTAMGGILNGDKTHLVKVPGLFAPDTALATLLANEATWPGYAAKLVGTWSNAYVDADGRAKTTGATNLWQTTGAGPAETMYGEFITNAAGTVLHFVQPYDAPRTLASTDDGYEHAVTLTKGT